MWQLNVQKTDSTGTRRIGNFQNVLLLMCVKLSGSVLWVDGSSHTALCQNILMNESLGASFRWKEYSFFSKLRIYMTTSSSESQSSQLKIPRKHLPAGDIDTCPQIYILSTSWASLLFVLLSEEHIFLSVMHIKGLRHSYVKDCFLIRKLTAVLFRTIQILEPKEHEVRDKKRKRSRKNLPRKMVCNLIHFAYTILRDF